jgi:hypothetical protein
MKTYGGVEVQLNTFFNLGTRWRYMVNFTPLPLYSWGNNQGLYLCRSRICGKEKNVLSLPVMFRRAASNRLQGYYLSWYWQFQQIWGKVRCVVILSGNDAALHIW